MSPPPGGNGEGVQSSVRPHDGMMPSGFQGFQEYLNRGAQNEERQEKIGVAGMMLGRKQGSDVRFC